MSVPASYGLYPSHSGYFAGVNIICFKEFGPLGLAVRIEGDWDEVSNDTIAVW